MFFFFFFFFGGGGGAGWGKRGGEARVPEPQGGRATVPESQLIVAAMLNLSNFHPLLKSKVAAIPCTALQILRTPL